MKHVLRWIGGLACIAGIAAIYGYPPSQIGVAAQLSLAILGGVFFGYELLEMERKEP